MKKSLLLIGLSLMVCVSAWADVIYDISVTSGIENGAIAVDKSSAAAGETVTITVTPSEGCELSELSAITMVNPVIDDPNDVWAPSLAPGDYDGYTLPVGWYKHETLTLTEVDESTYTFVMPAAYADYDGYKVLVGGSFAETAAPATSHSITVAKAENCTVTPSKDSAVKDETVTVTLMPDDGATFKSFAVYRVYEIGGGSGGARAPKKITARDNLTDVTTITEGEEYSFVMPDYDVEIEAVFEGAEPEKFSITVTQKDGGTTSTDKAEAAENETVTITATPNEGYEVDKVTAYRYMNMGFFGSWIDLGQDAITKIDDTHYSFAMPGSNARVEVTYKALPEETKYDVVIDAQIENGSITADKEKAAIGETVTLTVTANEGYEIEEVTVKAGYVPTAGDDDDDMAPMFAPAATWVLQDNIEVSKIDDTHYQFTLPEQFNNDLTPNYVEGTQFRVNASFKQSTVTAIDKIDANSGIDDGARYNLNGQRVDESYKGIVILKGKKILVK